MGTLKLPYVVQDVDRHGNVRTYIRLPGKPKIRVRATPGTMEFAAIYDEALGSKPQVSRPTAGTFEALCEAYFRSPTFKALDRSTRTWRERALRPVIASDGDKPFALMQPKHVRRLRNELAGKPVAANKRLKALKALFKWAVEVGEAERNPAREVDTLRENTRGFHTWTIEEVEQYEARHPVGSKARLAMALLLYTAGRREDATRLGPQHIRTVTEYDDDGHPFKRKRVQFVQAKNEHRKPSAVDVPAHMDLLEAIEACPSGHACFLVTEYGKPYTPAGFGNWFRDRCVEAGVPGRAHGLRKALLTRLAESGATPKEMQSWSGHFSADELETYTAAANKPRMANAAFDKLTRRNARSD